MTQTSYLDTEIVDFFRAGIEANGELLWDHFRHVATDFVDFKNPGEGLKEPKLNYKHKSISQVQAGLAALNIQGPPTTDQAEALLNIIQKANTNIVNFRGWNKTFGTEPEVVTEVVASFLAFSQRNLSLEEFLATFSRHSLKPTWDALSFALWTLDATTFFPIKISYYLRLAESLGTPFKKKREGINENSFIEAMSFGTAFGEFLKPSQLRLRVVPFDLRRDEIQLPFLHSFPKDS